MPLGGHLAGNYTQLGEVLRLLGWEIYTTCYVSTLTVALLVGLAIVMVVPGVAVKRPAKA